MYHVPDYTILFILLLFTFSSQYSNNQFTRFVAQDTFVFIGSALVISILYSFDFLYTLHACKGLSTLQAIYKTL